MDVIEQKPCQGEVTSEKTHAMESKLSGTFAWAKKLVMVKTDNNNSTQNAMRFLESVDSE